MQDQVDTPPKWEQQVLEKTLLASVIEHRRSRRWGIFFKLIILAWIVGITLMWYQGSGTAKPTMKDHIALIDLKGTIGQGQEIDADQVVTSLRKAFDEKKVKAIILRINSP